jgi:hypothetical protein
MTPDQLYVHGFLWGLGLGAGLGALLVLIWNEGEKTKRRKWR